MIFFSMWNRVYELHCQRRFNYQLRHKAPVLHFTPVGPGIHYPYSESGFYRLRYIVAMAKLPSWKTRIRPKRDLFGGGFNKRLDQAEWERRARIIHGTKYDYSESVFTKLTDRITFRCPEHGYCTHQATDHLRGSGCFKCGKKRGGVKNTLTGIDVIDQSKQIHGDRYDYSETRYSGYNKKFTIKCKIHGTFRQTAGNHLQGAGCLSCANVEHGNTLRLDQQDWINDCNTIHRNFYDYSKVVYERHDKPVRIVCPLHGEFSQRAGVHKNGSGCPSCGTILAQKKRLLTDSIQDMNHPALFYLLEIQVDLERFLKVGITKHTLRSRYNPKVYDGFQIRQLHTLQMKYCDAIHLEGQILIRFSDYKYRTQRRFQGHTECLRPEALLDVCEYLDDISPTQQPPTISCSAPFDEQQRHQKHLQTQEAYCG